ncbi:MAG: HAMP domain-containing protein [Lachnospiraceae bacterium]|nr:HAMP domain-containing protein [Lachnospiraceae bacterium]
MMAIFICWGINKFFLSDYYQAEKVKTIQATYAYMNTSQMRSTMEKGSLTEEEYFAIDRVCELNSVVVNVYNTNVEGIYATNNRWDNILKNVLQEYLYPMKRYQIQMLEKQDNYSITTLYDPSMNTSYLDLFGNLDNGYIILIRSNLESLQESVEIANKFLTYVGILTAVITMIVMYLVSGSFSRPIKKLAAIAKRMSDLDFDAKYPVRQNDEVGELGESINVLSEKLEKTISELKSANNELQSDIQNKIQIDEMRKDFLSNVTHELKTPIALIQGYAEGLKDNINEDPESREFYCDVIIDEAMKMNKMVKKLLTLNQIEFGKTPIEMGRFDLNALIQSVLSSTNILFQQKEVTVHYEAKENLYVWADEYLIEEVFTNYISNAVHHVSGANIIEVKVIQKDGIVRVAVYNTGERIPEEELDKIWIKFYKVDKARTREYGGSGIGLSIVKAIMDSHNQACGVVNHENGVEFWFELDAKPE